jgi:Icc-related predicted phosphoesterase
VPRLFFASDFHGSQMVWNKFLRAPQHLGVDTLICGGDITGKMIVPLIDQGNGLYTYYLYGRVERVKEDQIGAAESRISASGYYPYRTTPEEVAELERDEATRKSLFERLMKERVALWIEQATERLPEHVPIYMMPGNDDTWAIDAVFARQTRVIFAEGKLVPIGDSFEMITFGPVNPTPWDSPREAPEERLETMMDRLFARATDPSRLIANLHAPPYHSGLDMAPALDNNRRPITGILGVKKAPIGSKAVRNLIEKYQPLIGLHGHVHESPGKAKLGRTICINPGSEYAEGVLRGFVIELDRAGVKDIRMVYK